jgi:DUF1680 family protein
LTDRSVIERAATGAAAPRHDHARSAGPVALTDAARARLRPLAGEPAVLGADGFLGRWQALNRAATIDHCIANLESRGNLDNLRRLADPERGEFRGYWFADSDIYKVLEAIGWESGRAGDAGWSAFVDEAVAVVRDAQEPDGYVNSWIQGVKPDRRWRDLEMSHELYCAGHMLQGAVALSRGAGRDDLLELARRFADLAVERFGADGGEPGLDGHPEVETALVELYRQTADDRYLALASRMVERRGHRLLPTGRFGSQYLQDHLPVREATEPIGHAVRQLYLAAGVTDVYLETGDESLLEAMERLWERTVTEKMYVTGGHGSRHRDEAYGDPYELPPDRAYAETCAAIAAFHWNWRLLLATGRGRYADEMERALYNGVAVSTSLDGCHFTYSNPLHLRSGHDGSDEDAPSERLEWFSCACCPPNLARLVASLGHYVATTDADGIQLHLHGPARIETRSPAGEPVRLAIASEYPWDGHIAVEVEAGGGEWTLSLRVPEWAEAARLTVDGRPVEAAPDTRGYVHVRRDWQGTTSVGLELPMAVRVLHAHPRVDAVRGCVALARGPLVYCIEQADHADDVPVEDLRLDPVAPPQPDGGAAELGVDVVLKGRAALRTDAPDALYTTAPAAAAAQPRPAELTAIPYFRWGNRGPNAMRVWIPTV